MKCLARLGLTTFLLFAAATAFGYDCKVSCPAGYHGGCVKSSGGCDCSCEKGAKEVVSYILKALKTANASDKLIMTTAAQLDGKDEFPETTLTDSDGKTFVIFLKKSQSTE